MTTAAQNISKQVAHITRANGGHSKGAVSVLDSLRAIRKITAQNSEGARETLRGTQNLLDTIEALVADMHSLDVRTNNGKSGRKVTSQKRRQSKNGQ